MDVCIQSVKSAGSVLHLKLESKVLAFLEGNNKGRKVNPHKVLQCNTLQEKMSLNEICSLHKKAVFLKIEFLSSFTATIKLYKKYFKILLG